MTTSDSLSERERQALKHMRKAQELGTTLKEYAAKIGLDVKQLYQIRGRLVRKGVLGPAWGKVNESVGAGKASAFLPVRIVSSGPSPGRTPVACRLVHPSGCVLEFDGFPPASWVAAILSGGAHAAA